MSIGSLINMKHNTKHTYDIGRSNHFSLKEIVSMILSLNQKVDNVSNNVSKLMLLLLTEDTIDISEFFPITSLDKLNEFMDRSHPQWSSRLKGFNHLLTIHDDQKKFADALLAALFSRDLLASVKWPSAG